MKIVCLDGHTLYPVNDPVWAQFAEIADFEIYDRTSRDQIVGRAAGAEIVLTNKVPFDADTIKALPALKCICVLATGYNIVDTVAARQVGITVCNIPAYSTRSVAQQVFALILALNNRVEDYAHRVAGGAWASSPDFTFRIAEWSELAGKTIGIVGYGAIGQAVAAIADAFGMKVALYTSKSADVLPSHFEKMSLDGIFATSDIVSLHCPLTADTKGMVDARRLSLMKSSAVLINTARGPLVDEAALAEALNSGKIAAAGLDVLSSEPPAADCPLLCAQNCYITPHIAWASTEARQRLFAIALSNVKAYVAGAPINVVN